MSLRVLDTDILTLFAHGNWNVTRRLYAHGPHRVAVSVISAQEMLDGWLGFIKRQTRPDQIAHGYQRLEATIPLLAGFASLPYRESTMTLFARLRGLRLNVGTNDLRIAATALEQNAVVVTRNLRDFGRVPGVLAEDWAA